MGGRWESRGTGSAVSFINVIWSSLSKRDTWMHLFHLAGSSKPIYIGTL